MESTFLSFKEELVLSETFEDLRNVMAMFGQSLGVNQNIINVNNNGVMKEISEHLVHEILEYRGGVYRTIQHDQVLTVASRCHEGCLPLISLTYPDKVICPTKLFQSCWNQRKWVPELDSDVIECSVIYAGP